MMKRHASSPVARQEISVATRGTPKLSSHQPEEYPAFMRQTGKSLRLPARDPGIRLERVGVIVEKIIVLVGLGLRFFGYFHEGPAGMGEIDGPGGQLADADRSIPSICGSGRHPLFPAHERCRIAPDLQCSAASCSECVKRRLTISKNSMDSAAPRTRTNCSSEISMVPLAGSSRRSWKNRLTCSSALSKIASNCGGVLTVRGIAGSRLRGPYGTPTRCSAR